MIRDLRRRRPCLVYLRVSKNHLPNVAIFGYQFFAAGPDIQEKWRKVLSGSSRRNRVFLEEFTPTLSVSGRLTFHPKKTEAPHAKDT